MAHPNEAPATASSSTTTPAFTTMAAMATNADLDSSTSLRDRAYARIKAQILDGELRPGTAISEAERADVLGMSRSPVREALQQLARDGLVEVLPKRGTFVAELTPRDVREAFELREAVETACARLAAERRTDGDIVDLVAACDAIDQAATVHERYEAGATFHSTVARVARSRYLHETFESSQAKIDMASRAAADTIVHHARELSHRDILDAIIASDGDRAADLMRGHLDESMHSLIEKLL
jgi:DNA-binding GntR family transcriptional regulator